MDKLDFLRRVLVAIKAIDEAKQQQLAIEIDRLDFLLMDAVDFGCRRMIREEKDLLRSRILAQPGTTWFQTMQVLKACGVDITELMNVPWPKL